MTEMVVWAETKRGSDGLDYNARYLLSREECEGLRAAGVIGNISEVVGMQMVADAGVVRLEKAMETPGDD